MKVNINVKNSNFKRGLLIVLCFFALNANAQDVQRFLICAHNSINASGVNTPDSDRLTLRRWLLLSYASHLDLPEGVRSTRKQRSANDRKVILIFNRILNVDCIEHFDNKLRDQRLAAAKELVSIMAGIARYEISRSHEIADSLGGFLSLSSDQIIQGLENDR